MVERRKPKKVNPLNPNEETAESIRTYIQVGLAGFENDPPVNPFQKGFVACLTALWEDLYMTTADRKLSRSKIRGNS